MNQEINNLCEALDNLSNAVLALSNTDTDLIDQFGFNHPPLNRTELASMPKGLASKLREADINNVPDELEARIADIVTNLGKLQSITVPHFMNGNGVTALPVYFNTLTYIDFTIQPLVGWQTLTDTKAMPNRLANRLKALQIGIEEIVPEKQKLEDQIKLIQEAYATAESLPTDLQSLREARNKVSAFSSDAAELYGKIDVHSQSALEAAKRIAANEDEAKQLVAQCYEAYRITTSTGLAGAFDDRAKRLSSSMWIWVLGLSVALGLGAWVGTLRYESLIKVLDITAPSWGVVWVHIILSLFSLAAPIWFAWLSTKQIAQRFRLSEDYAYKASVAKAYEGYKREAAKLDPEFEARLFGSALTRLEEAPLRLVEGETHGSPWQEFFASEGFKQAIATIPEFKKDFLNAFKGSATIFSKVKSVESTTSLEEE